MESAWPWFNISVASVRFLAGMNSMLGKTFAASFAIGLVSSSGKMSFMSIL